jgi:hypothetical protein
MYLPQLQIWHCNLQACSTLFYTNTSSHFAALEWQPSLHHHESTPTDGRTMLRQHALCGHYNKHKTALILRPWLSSRRHRECGQIHRQKWGFSWFSRLPQGKRRVCNSVTACTESSAPHCHFINRRRIIISPLSLQWTNVRIRITYAVSVIYHKDPSLN